MTDAEKIRRLREALLHAANALDWEGLITESNEAYEVYIATGETE